MIGVDADAFFTEGSLVMCCGLHNNDCFYISHMRQPPLHARKSFIFKVNEADYFGAYSLKKEMLALPHSKDQTLPGLTSAVQTKARNEALQALPPPDPCIVILSQLELD